MGKVIEVKNLTKRFGSGKKSFLAVKGISFEVREGEIVGILGPNGAGKTTTITMLLGLTKPTEGEVKIFGKSLERDREWILSKVNFASAEMKMHARLSVFNNLLVFAYLYNVENPKRKVMAVLEDLEIGGLAGKKFINLSAGQRMRVILARTLINRPRLILLDEPTASLDPMIAEKVQDLFLSIVKKHKVTILYTSHNMAEVTKMCDRVIFLSKGEIVALDTPLNLAKKVEKSVLVLTFDGKEEKVKRVLNEKGYKGEFVKKGKVEVEVSEDEIAGVLINLSAKGIWITDVGIRKPDLADVFRIIAKGKNEFWKN